MTNIWSRFRRFIVDDSLSLAFFVLYLICVAGQAWSGWLAYGAALRRARLPGIPLPAYFITGHFLDGIFSNWQAAILQLAVLIAFSSVLRQKGAAHSRRDNGDPRRSLSWNLHFNATIPDWLKANSMSLVFFALFLAAFVLHALFGHWKHDEQQALMRLSGSSIGAYFVSAEFWNSVFECWEAEFGVIGTYVVLSIFLRQEASPESKPTEASDEQTGGVNE